MDSNLISYETLQATIESAKWAKWSAYGSWFSGIATFGAVIASLYIALRKPRSIISGHVTLIKTFNHLYETEGVNIKIVNQSLHSVKINEIVWEWGADTAAQQAFRNAESDKLPIRIEHGEEASYLIILNGNDDDWIHRFAKTLNIEKVKIEKLKCFAVLSTGHRFHLEMRKSFKERIKGLMQHL